MVTAESGTLEVMGSPFIAELELMNQIVYALKTVGAGRVIFSGDSNTLYLEETDCPLWEWLGSTGSSLPRVLTFGAPECTTQSSTMSFAPAFPTHDVEYNLLPAQFVGDPAALKAAYDVVIYCETPYFRGDDLPTAEVQTLIDYVTLQGGGLYLMSEWFTYLNQDDIDAVNRIANPLGANFLPTDLEWGGIEGQVSLSCFPPPAVG